jgi:hypothetical protein
MQENLVKQKKGDIHKLPEWVARVWVHGRSSLLVASASGVLPQAPSTNQGGQHKEILSKKEGKRLIVTICSVYKLKS